MVVANVSAWVLCSVILMVWIWKLGASYLARKPLVVQARLLHFGLLIVLLLGSAPLVTAGLAGSNWVWASSLIAIYLAITLIHLFGSPLSYYLIGGCFSAFQEHERELDDAGLTLSKDRELSGLVTVDRLQSTAEHEILELLVSMRGRDPRIFEARHFLIIIPLALLLLALLGGLFTAALIG